MNWDAECKHLGLHQGVFLLRQTPGSQLSPALIIKWPRQFSSPKQNLSVLDAKNVMQIQDTSSLFRAELEGVSRQFACKLLYLLGNRGKDPASCGKCSFDEPEIKVKLQQGNHQNQRPACMRHNAVFSMMKASWLWPVSTARQRMRSTSFHLAGFSVTYVTLTDTCYCSVHQ